MAKKSEILQDQAVAGILEETARGKERTKTMGAMGWKRPNKTTNKEFLRRTLASTLRYQRPKSSNTSGKDVKTRQQPYSRESENESLSQRSRTDTIHAPSIDDRSKKRKHDEDKHSRSEDKKTKCRREKRHKKSKRRKDE